MITLFSGTVIGLDALPVTVEIDLNNGLPTFEIVGLAGMAVRESRERVRAAINNSGFNFPMKKIIVNLAPAAIKKEGTLFDLPIALGILANLGHIQPTRLKEFIIAGELSLAGEVRPVNGMLSLAELATKLGKKMLVPAANSKEAASGNKQVYGVKNLLEAVNFLKGEISLKVIKPQSYHFEQEQPNWHNIKGQQVAKRMLMIAACGHHHCLLMGAPGTGKTLLANSVKNLLTPLTLPEAIEVTKIYSMAGLLQPNSGLVTTRPVRSPHHTITQVGLVGGGNPIQPGEITLASHGVLILDEMLEFSNQALQALREPLEAGYVSIVRANQRIKFPAKFLLVATANPCPCGFFGDDKQECRCQIQQIRNYQKKLLGPLLDRIDLFTFLPNLDSDDYQKTENSTDIILPITEKNGLMTDQEVQSIKLTGECQQFLLKAQKRLNLSARGYYKTIKIAKTISEIEQASSIELPHLAEALQYRWENLNLVNV